MHTKGVSWERGETYCENVSMRLMADSVSSLKFTGDGLAR